MGLKQAGFDVTGVDITDNHQYPFEFIHSDVFDLDLDFIKQFDLIWASPPCQAFSYAARQWKRDYPDLVDKTRQLLLKIKKPFIIENVMGAPVRKDIILCGEMFGLRVLRHRIFEIHGFTVLQPPHVKHKPPINKKSYYAIPVGHGCNGFSCKIKDWQKSMGIDWINTREHLSQAIPPAYSNYLASSIL